MVQNDFFKLLTSPRLSFYFHPSRRIYFMWCSSWLQPTHTSMDPTRSMLGRVLLLPVPQVGLMIDASLCVKRIIDH